MALADTDKAQEYFSSTCAPEAGDSKAHAYNPTNEEKTVTFSDGKVIKVAPKAQSEEQKVLC